MNYLTDAKQIPNSELKVSNSNQKITFVDQIAIQNCHFKIDLEPETELIIIDSARDGIEQITEILAERNNIESLQIIGSTNSNEANLQLGLTQLNIYTLEAYIDDLQQWQNALATKSEILLYGCLVVGSSMFQRFLQQLAGITGADIGAFVSFPNDLALVNNQYCDSLMVAWQSQANSWFPM